MYNVDVYTHRVTQPKAKLRTLSVNRDWMHPMTYNCSPVTLVNMFGYGVYFDQDVSFVWDGDRATPARALAGQDFIWEGRGEGTVSFTTGLVFKTDENVSMMTLPVPNEYIHGCTVVSTVLSTSFFTGDYPIVLKIHDEMIGKEITIPAGTNIACIVPISVSQFQGTKITMHESVSPITSIHDNIEYLKALDVLNKQGIRPRWYKKAIDHLGNKIGNHEIDRFDFIIEEGKN